MPSFRRRVPSTTCNTHINIHMYTFSSVDLFVLKMIEYDSKQPNDEQVTWKQLILT